MEGYEAKNPWDKLCDAAQDVQSSLDVASQKDTHVPGQRLTMRVAEVAEGFFDGLWNSIAGQKKFAILGSENLEGAPHLPATPYNDGQKIGSDEVIIQVAVMKLEKGVGKSADTDQGVMKVAVKVNDLAKFLNVSNTSIQKDAEGYAMKGTQIPNLIIQREQHFRNLQNQQQVQEASQTSPTLFAAKAATEKVQELNRAYCAYRSVRQDQIYAPLTGKHFVKSSVLNGCSLNPDSPRSKKPEAARQTLLTQLDKPEWKPGIIGGILDWFTDFGKNEEFKGIEEQYGKEACDLYKKTYSESRGDFANELNKGLKQSHDDCYGALATGWSDPTDKASSFKAFQKGNLQECKKISDAGEIKALGLMMIEQALLDSDSTQLTKLYKHLCPKGNATDNQTMAKEIREHVCNHGGNPSLHNFLTQVCKLDKAQADTIEKMVDTNYAKRPNLATLNNGMQPNDLFTLK